MIIHIRYSKVQLEIHFIGFAVHALHVDKILCPRRDKKKLMAATTLLSQRQCC